MRKQPNAENRPCLIRARERRNCHGSYTVLSIAPEYIRGDGSLDRDAVSAALRDLGLRGGARRSALRQPIEVVGRDFLTGLTETCEFWHDSNNIAYVSLPADGDVEHCPVKSPHFVTWLSGKFYEETGAAISGLQLQDAIQILEAVAVRDGSEYDPFARVGSQCPAKLIELARKHEQSGLTKAAIDTHRAWWRVVADRAAALISDPDLTIDKIHGMTWDLLTHEINPGWGALGAVQFNRMFRDENGNSLPPEGLRMVLAQLRTKSTDVLTLTESQMVEIGNGADNRAIWVTRGCAVVYGSLSARCEHAE